ncbi:phage tail protein [Domibacillus aminovorans]|uniref:phage tail protein n=1 Tax=Domibacillus aminovorans TaxID=29332 RepID=UPI003D1B9517
MQIGSFATVIFQVSSKKVLTFNEFSRSGGARWSVHDVNQNKPMPEFVGPGQESVSLKIVLKTSLGIAPEAAVERLRGFRNKGQISSLIIGNKPVTNGYWYIDDIQEGHKFFDQHGVAHSIEVTLALKEYPKPTAIRVKPKPTASKGTALGKKTAVNGVVTIKASSLNCRTSPSLKGKVKKSLRKNQTFKVYGTVKTDIEWYILGGGLYCSANTKYVSFKKANTASVSFKKS